MQDETKHRGLEGQIPFLQTRIFYSKFYRIFRSSPPLFRILLPILATPFPPLQPLKPLGLDTLTCVEAWWGRPSANGPE